LLKFSGGKIELFLADAKNKKEGQPLLQKGCPSFLYSTLRSIHTAAHAGTACHSGSSGSISCARRTGAKKSTSNILRSSAAGNSSHAA
jgi:hypothetical protein